MYACAFLTFVCVRVCACVCVCVRVLRYVCVCVCFQPSAVDVHPPFIGICKHISIHVCGVRVYVCVRVYVWGKGSVCV